MKIVVDGFRSFKLFDENGQEVNLRVLAADIRLRPDEFPSAIIEVAAKDLDITLLPQDITIIPIEEKE